MHGDRLPQVAVLYDKAEHFVASEPALMKTLTSAEGFVASAGESHPNQLEYVPNQDLVRGVDY